MRFVPVKSVEQSDIQALHRAGSRLVTERTALITRLRALFLQRGIVVAKGRRKLEDALLVFANEENAGNVRDIGDTNSVSTHAGGPFLEKAGYNQTCQNGQ